MLNVARNVSECKRWRQDWWLEVVQRHSVSAPQHLAPSRYPVLWSPPAWPWCPHQGGARREAGTHPALFTLINIIEQGHVQRLCIFCLLTTTNASTLHYPCLVILLLTAEHVATEPATLLQLRFQSNLFVGAMLVTSTLLRLCSHHHKLICNNTQQ